MAEGHDETAAQAGPDPSGVQGRSDEGAGADTLDGRTSRRTRNRSAVIDAALALYDERRYPFTLHDVAERSGGGLDRGERVDVV
ncbi:hypothetical protein BH23ACT3_BH23ACT3_00500 [soil metagenome]